ncbi:MAG: hypothetical protein OHK0022_16120 [Roseiflexaceae bacterium]
MIPFSILDLAPVVQGGTPALAFQNTLDLARHAERWGYRRMFQPSEALERPYAMAAINVVAADTGAEAQRLATSVQQLFLSLRRGQPGPLPPPVDNIEEYCSPAELAGLRHLMTYSVVGDPAAVQHGIAAFIEQTGVDELMVTGQIFDHAARLRSFELVAAARPALTGGAL